MATNLLKRYNELLELNHLGDEPRKKSLYGVFDRDIVQNPSFRFRSKQINPTNSEGIPMQNLFNHLITVVVDQVTKRREYEPMRSERLHWIKHHVEEKKKNNMLVFSCKDPEGIRTYIYDEDENYVMVLDPYRNGTEYYLLTCFRLTGRDGTKIRNKHKRKLPDVY